MEVEHRSDYSFTTSNYDLTTTPSEEWAIVVESKKPEDSHMVHGRRIPDAKSLARKQMEEADRRILAVEGEDYRKEVKEEKESIRDACLKLFEIYMLILYTGPMVRRRLATNRVGQLTPL